MSKRLTPRQAADRLNVSTKRIYAMLRTGKLHGINVSTGNERPRWRIEEAEVERFGGKSRAA